MAASYPVQVGVALYRRDPISSDPHKRRIYQREAYHWVILIITAGACDDDDDVYDAYDATDTNTINPITLRQNNPRGDWWLNAGTDVDPERSKRLLGYIIIGALPAETTREDAGRFLKDVALPQRNKDPQQSCVTWVADAIRKLREHHCVEDFEVDRFLDWALAFADQRLWCPDETDAVLYYDKETEKPEKGKKKEGQRRKVLLDRHGLTTTVGRKPTNPGE